MTVRRREFIFSTCAVAVWPSATSSQPTAKIPSIGYLAFAPVGWSGVPDHSYEAFRSALRELGYVEDQNIVILDRIAHGQVELLPKLAMELVQLSGPTKRTNYSEFAENFRKPSLASANKIAPAQETVF